MEQLSNCTSRDVPDFNFRKSGWSQIGLALPVDPQIRLGLDLVENFCFDIFINFSILFDFFGITAYDARPAFMQHWNAYLLPLTILQTAMSLK